MITPNLKTAFDFTLGWEVGKNRDGTLKQDGGYTNDPDDPGGETKWGISKRSHQNLDIKNLTLEDALEIYRQEYWLIYSVKNPRLDLDAVPRDYAVSVFDSGVSTGPNRAYYWHLKSIETKDPTKTMLGLRDKYYFDLVTMKPEMKKYYKGWLNRMNDLKKLVDVIRAEDRLLLGSWKKPT